MLPSDMRKKRTGKERLAGQVAMHWYNRGYRGRTLHQKIEESLAKGKLEDNTNETCTKDICG
tara:strand:- start:3318 stop:3503 length:186 start_codon:yes stop_codon:yes gene_type:complete